MKYEKCSQILCRILWPNKKIQFGINDRNNVKTVENLSSGYKINRAAERLFGIDPFKNAVDLGGGAWNCGCERENCGRCLKCC